MGILLKALVDKENNRVIFAESDEDFVDVLFSFLTMPIGTIIRLTRNHQPPTMSIGCMNNLYESAANLDVKRFRTQNCKTMLLRPRNGAAAQCRSLKLKIDDDLPLAYFCCGRLDCASSKYKLLSHYENVSCTCGEAMSRGMNLFEGKSKDMASDALDEGVFVKGLTRLVISDELQVMPASTAASFSLLSKFGVMDASAIEERTFNIGVNEVLNLLKFSLESKTPLTETLLPHNAVPELSREDFDQGSFVKHQIEEHALEGNGEICVRLMLSKSKKMVCYAEVSQDFVDLLFSFLTIPLGYIVKEMRGGPSKGCINQLYESVQDLYSDRYLKSDDHREILLSPKIVPGFGYENQPLGVEEVNHQYYYVLLPLGFGAQWKLTTDRTLTSFNDSGKVHLNLMDPKSPSKEATTGEGFVIGPAKFMVTDDLFITPISPVSGLSVLNKLKVPFNDIEERIVQVGNEEASRLLVASFISESALTDAFLRKEPKQEY